MGVDCQSGEQSYRCVDIVHVCVYILVYILCMHVCVCLYRHRTGYVLYVCESLCVCVYIDVCMCISISLCIFISVYADTYIYIRSVCVCVEVQAFVGESCSLSVSAVLCLTPEPSVRCGHSVACIALATYKNTTQIPLYTNNS